MGLCDFSKHNGIKLGNEEEPGKEIQEAGHAPYTGRSAAFGSRLAIVYRGVYWSSTDRVFIVE